MYSAAAPVCRFGRVYAAAVASFSVLTTGGAERVACDVVGCWGAAGIWCLSLFGVNYPECRCVAIVPGGDSLVF